jgi:hypothetical protein
MSNQIFRCLTCGALYPTNPKECPVCRQRDFETRTEIPTGEPKFEAGGIIEDESEDDDESEFEDETEDDDEITAPPRRPPPSSPPPSARRGRPKVRK